MAVLCYWQLPPQLADAEGEDDKIYQVEPVASVTSFWGMTFPTHGGTDKGKAQPCRNMPLLLLASSLCTWNRTVLEDKITSRLFT